MPVYPSLVEQDVNEPLDFSNLKYPFGQEVSMGFRNAYQHYQTNEIVNNLSRIKPDPSVPDSFPITQVDVNNLTENRPGLKIPLGIPKFVGSVMTSMYDNDKAWSLVAQHPASIFGHVGAIGASMAGGAADPKTWIGGAVVGKLGKIAATSLAEQAINTFGARELYGSAAAHIGTLLAQGVGEGAGFSAGAQAETELSEQQKRVVTDEPHDYIRSLQNIGASALLGGVMGLPISALHLSLAGRPVFEMPNGDVVENIGQPKPDGAVERKEGGLLNRPEFKNISDTAKEYIGKIYKPWSQDADITMKEEATGQMLNGQFVGVDPVLKQGMIDEGANFREAAKNGGIDTEALDSALADAQENITSELFSQHFAEQFEKPQAIEQPEPVLYRGRSDNTFGFKTLEEAGTSEAALLKEDHELGKGYWYTESKEHAATYGNIIEEARGNFNVFDVDNNDNPELTRMYKDIHNQALDLTKLADTKQKIEDFRRAVKDAGYQGIRRFGVVGKDAGRYETMFFEKPKTPEQLQQEAVQRKNADLMRQYTLAQSLRDHINDTHEPLTQEDVAAYGKHLKTTGIPDNGYKTEAPNFSIDDYLNNFSDEQIRDLEEKFQADKDLIRELEATRDKLANQKIFAEMTKNMTDCILQGAV